MATTPYGYNNTGDPRKAAANQRALITQGGDTLQNQYQQQYSDQQGGAPVNTVAGTANYLNNIEDPLAQGQGGYNSEETGQIELSPEQKQAIITGAGTSAGTGTAAQVGAADRATAASGGNPLAMAAYRARAADTEGAQGGDAMTRARVQAQEAGSAGAQAVGNARLAQQNQGLNFYKGQNSQANQNAQQANQLQESTYGTEANAGNTATKGVVDASQTPSTFDKVTGLVAGAAKAFLEDGSPGGSSAVVGEGGTPEWVGKPSYLDNGTIGSGETDTEGPGLPTDFAGTSRPGDDSSKVPFWQRIRAHQQPGASTQQQSAQPVQQWNKTIPYAQLGNAIGTVAGSFLDDGAVPAAGDPADHSDYEPYLPDVSSVPPRSMFASGTIFTKPTNVRLEKEEAVVPLGYRQQAKVRPSMALKSRGMYGAAA